MFVTTSLFFWVHIERNKILDLYNSIQSSSKYEDFAVLQEYLPKLSKFTYAVTDEYGKVHEITESVHKNLNKKLRVGDTVVVNRKTVVILGKKELIASIKGNTVEFPLLHVLEDFLKYGVAIFGFTLFSAGIAFLLVVLKK